MSNQQTQLTSDQKGWLLLGGAGLILLVMVLWVIPPRSLTSFAVELLVTLLIVGGGLAAGVLKYKNR